MGGHRAGPALAHCECVAVGGLFPCFSHDAHAGRRGGCVCSCHCGSSPRYSCLLIATMALGDATIVPTVCLPNIQCHLKSQREHQT